MYYSWMRYLIYLHFNMHKINQKSTTYRKFSKIQPFDSESKTKSHCILRSLDPSKKNRPFHFTVIIYNKHFFSSNGTGQDSSPYFCHHVENDDQYTGETPKQSFKVKFRQKCQDNVFPEKIKSKNIKEYDGNDPVELGWYQWKTLSGNPSRKRSKLKK